MIGGGISRFVEYSSEGLEAGIEMISNARYISFVIVKSVDYDPCYIRVG